MEFELQLKPPTSTPSASVRLTGLQVASMTMACSPSSAPGSVSPPLLILSAPGMDDRHGIIRAAAALLALLPMHQPGSDSVSEPVASQQSPGRQQRPRGIFRLRRTRRTGRSPPRASAAATSVSVAAGEGAHQAANKAAQARPLQQLLAGGVAGAVSKTLVAPLERISTMLMTDGHRHGFGVGEAVAHAWREGGLVGLFRGNAATLAKIFPASAIQFAVFHGLKDALLAARLSVRSGDSSSKAGSAGSQKQGELSNAERLLAGAAAGAASVSVTYPLESTRTLMSVAGGMEGSLLSVCRRVVAKGGVAALYRGFRATLLGDVMGNALGFTFYEIGNRAWKDGNGGVAAPPSVRGVIGALSAACVMTFTMPLEVVRRRLQIQGTLGRPVLYRGTVDCIAKIARKEGLAGFYRAALPSYLKVAPSIGCMYFLYELLTNHLDSAATVATTADASSSPSGAPLPTAGRPQKSAGR